MKPTGGEGERQAGTTPIFPKKTEEPFLTTSLTSSGYVINNSDTYAKVRDPAVVSFHSKCKVWEQRPDTVWQFKEPCQCGVPRIFQGAA